jgi:hypothetical protein
MNALLATQVKEKSSQNWQHNLRLFQIHASSFRSELVGFKQVFQQPPWMVASLQHAKQAASFPAGSRALVQTVNGQTYEKVLLLSSSICLRCF